MKKYLLILLLLGCANEKTIPAPLVVPGPISTNHSDGISWICQQDELNEKLVWISCDFQNNSFKVAETCINVAYFTRSDQKVPFKLVAHSRNLCTGPLWPRNTTTNYAAFVDKDRAILKQECGKDLSNCLMDTFMAKKTKEQY